MELQAEGFIRRSRALRRKQKRWKIAKRWPPRRRKGASGCAGCRDWIWLRRQRGWNGRSGQRLRRECRKKCGSQNDKGALRRNRERKNCRIFSNLKGVTGYGPDGGDLAVREALISKFLESTGQAAVGGATRGQLGRRWTSGDNNISAAAGSREPDECGTGQLVSGTISSQRAARIFHALDENKEKPGTYSWAALENQKRILDEAGQRAGIFQKVDQYQKQAGGDAAIWRRIRM